mmetsp:Transcript_2530/g.3730  ORF Transcript_2530/g.3730 Transcript_2530/m.3730 type:complete len:1042 (+) Transcript_2530:199-3324(+)
MVRQSTISRQIFYSKHKNNVEDAPRTSISKLFFPSNNMTDFIFERSVLGPKKCAPLRDKGLHCLPAGFVQKIDRHFEHVPDMVLELHAAVTDQKIDQIEAVVSRITDKLVDELGVPLNPRDSYNLDISLDYDQKMKRLDRDVFVSLGGPELLVTVLHRLCQNDCEIQSSNLQDTCNEILITLRELCFTDQSLSSRVISKDLVLLLFNLLKSTEISSSAIGLLEELLAVQTRAFKLDMIPNLYSYLRGLGSRQTAHMCRVLALVVFEPEVDRLANDRALRSMELLQLRRDRVARPSYTVDTNQAILIGMPELLPRLVSLLRLMNHGPAVDQLASYEMPQSLAAEVDSIMLRRAENEVNDWEFLYCLSDRAGTPEQGSGNSRDSLLAAGSDDSVSRGQLYGSQRGVFGLFSNVGRWLFGGQEGGETITEGQENSNPRATDGSMPPFPRPSNLTSNVGNQGRQRDIWYDTNETYREAIMAVTPNAARAELSIHALLVGHHQVEVLFVICTLLGGRRKRDVQLRLAELGIVEVLTNMFPRLSWGSHRSTSPLQRPHGAGCDCDPESALRVQWLRLVHNLVDREGGCAEVRKLTLSRTTRRLLNADSSTPGLREAECEAWANDDGLMKLIVSVLMKEPNDSPYRFWLASCVEAFLRGSSARDQLLIARSGLLEHLISDIIDYDRASEGNNGGKKRAQGALQTSFDLLGELIKGSLEVLILLEKDLTPDRLVKLIRVMRANLVDSNVFLRNLVLSLDHCSKGNNWDELTKEEPQSYLVASWSEVQAVGLPNRHDNYSKKKSNLFNVGKATRAEIWQLMCSWQKRDKAMQGNSKNKRERPVRKTEVHLEGEEEWSLTEMSEPGLQRLHKFLTKNLTSLARDLLAVVDATNVNHENICCLNTTVALLVLVRRQIGGDQAVAKALKQIRNGTTTAVRSYSRKIGVCEGGESGQDEEPPHVGPPRHGSEVLVSFRQLLWLWQEYYSHRGRDRLGIEFNSHINFDEWKSLVDLLCADDGSPTSLLSYPAPTPPSPYSREPRPDRLPAFLRNV